jgi:hypothetical protein
MPISLYSLVIICEFKDRDKQEHLRQLLKYWDQRLFVVKSWTPQPERTGIFFQSRMSFVKRLLLSAAIASLFLVASFAQMGAAQIEEA